ncbi:cation:proton antiporter [Desulfobulbus alkaliphilus]|uniref:cation:proton antiporter n=1 Tax=Desulfobulbus alkaliphilus TaxID=869814 RepID=UPI001F070C31|nr:cation:proton antiporter [Desulfobulbus alkaliphilus]
MAYSEHLFLVGGAMLFMFFLVSFIFQRLKLPSLLAYIFLGIAFAGLLTGSELDIIDQISRIGIVLLFFLLGLHFPLNRLINISRRVWKVGVMDIGFNFGGSFLIAYLFGFDLMAALVIGGVAYATSSSITVKMLEDTGRLKTPEGEFKLALLIFEDLAAPVMVSFLVGLSTHGAISAGAVGVRSLVKIT